MDGRWSERDSALYRKLQSIAVPDRAKQIATLLTLLPMAQKAPARIVELGCGAGALSFSIVNAFPRCEVLALDGSESMRSHAQTLAASVGPRFQVLPFALEETAWFDALDDADAVVSSLAIHHLSAAGKRRLFARVAQALRPGGALLVADLVEPTLPRQLALFADAWSDSARRQAAKRGQDALFDLFDEEHWNVFEHPDPVDQPSPLLTQLQWLAEEGLQADCFWLQAGHAIYGGYRPPVSSLGTSAVSFREALDIATDAVETVER